MTRRATDNTKALDAFIAAKTEIDAMLERLAALPEAARPEAAAALARAATALPEALRDPTVEPEE